MKRGERWSETEMNQLAQSQREERGRQIWAKGTEVRRVDGYTYSVLSQSGRGAYTVQAMEFGWRCSCPDYGFRNWDCKHVYAVRFSLKMRAEVLHATLAPIETTDACVYCGSKHVVKDGLRHNKAGAIQKFNCLECKRYFTVNLGFEKMKHDPKAITTAMQLYFNGESLRNTADSLRLLGVQVSHQTVYNWIRKYVSLMESHLEKLTPQVSDTWRADELWVKVKGNLKYVFAMMDDQTRFWIAQEVADTKDRFDARNLFRKSAEVAGKKPAILITDGLGSYHRAFNKEYRNLYNDDAVKPMHVKEIRLAGRIHNNKMERLNGEIRDREKTLRGLKRSDSPILKGYQLFHNYVRPHDALKGKTPADLAGIQVQGENKWLTLIQNAARTSQIP